MASFRPNPSWSVVDAVKISAPVDTTSPYDPSTLAGKTILITGGASGLCLAFARKWASHGAHIVIGDIASDKVGRDLVADLCSLPGSSQNHRYQRCDVTKWEDQVSLFKLALKASPTGVINGVVAGAGIIETRDLVNGPVFDLPHPSSDDPSTPPQPPLKVYDVSLTGVMYTAHLAIFYQQRKSEGPTDGSSGPQDRHLLLVSSIAGITPLPGQAEYTVAKHGVMGLFRVLRGSTYRRQGIRCNVVSPYFAQTPMVNAKGMALLAGGALARVDDVVDAATRLMADESIAGRGLAIGPRFKVMDDDEQTGDVRLMGNEEASGMARGQPVWEIYAHDYEQVEIFVWRFLALLNAVRTIRGWLGFFADMFSLWTTSKKSAKPGKLKAT